MSSNSAMALARSDKAAGVLTVRPACFSLDGANDAPVIGQLSLVGADSLLTEAFEALTQTERERAARFVRQADRDRFAAGRLLARSMLDEQFGIEMAGRDFDQGLHGKPCLRDIPDLDFSIAHAGDLVMVGMARGVRLGIDVERHRPDIEVDAIGALVFSVAERDWITGAKGAERIGRFFDQWCCKEAVVKALGTGFRLDPKRFEVTTEMPRAVRVLSVAGSDTAGNWAIAQLAVNAGYSAAVAYRKY